MVLARLSRGARELLVHPVHLKLTSIELLLNLVEVVDVPVLFCVFGEVNRKAGVDHGARQLLRSQSIETFLHELVYDMAVRLAICNHVFYLEVLYLTLKLILFSLLFEIDRYVINLDRIACIMKLPGLLGRGHILIQIRKGAHGTAGLELLLLGAFVNFGCGLRRLIPIV